MLETQSGQGVAFVPTMGALHEGHLSLIRQARALSENVTVSIFVNPLQFENPNDLAKYPRDLVGDIAKAKSAGATQVWAPAYDDVYPGAIKRLSAGNLGKIFEGESRPGHFDGMLTVVGRLIEIVKPKYAIFGEKDFQQLFIVKNWVKSNSIPVEIIAGEIVRENDGLAMSSRNVRLDSISRQAATVLFRALSSESRSQALKILTREPLFNLDYFEIVDPESFEPASSECVHARAIIAGWINGVRLLDNMPMRVDR